MNNHKSVNLHGIYFLSENRLPIPAIVEQVIHLCVSFINANVYMLMTVSVSAIKHFWSLWHKNRDGSNNRNLVRTAWKLTTA